jgi:hypothetical protein
LDASDNYNNVSSNTVRNVWLKYGNVHDTITNNNITLDITVGFDRASDNFDQNVAASITSSEASDSATAGISNSAYNNTVTGKILFRSVVNNVDDNSVYSNVVGGDISFTSGGTGTITGKTVHHNNIPSGYIYVDSSYSPAAITGKSSTFDPRPSPPPPESPL